MFYFLVAPYLMYNGVLIAAAVVPAILLMIKVYRSDRLDKESPYLIGHLIKAGTTAAAISTPLYIRYGATKK